MKTILYCCFLLLICVGSLSFSAGRSAALRTLEPARRDLAAIKAQFDETYAGAVAAQVEANRRIRECQALLDRPDFAAGVRFGFIAKGLFPELDKFPALTAKASNLWYVVTVERGTNWSRLQEAFHPHQVRPLPTDDEPIKPPDAI